MNSAKSVLTYRIAFSSVKGINRALALEILSRIDSEEEFFKINERQLSTVMGFNNKIFASDYRAKLIEDAEKESGFIESNNIRPFYFTDDDYPCRLEECADAPLMLYGIGECDMNEARIVGIVGTRHATPYGIDFTKKLVEDLHKKSDVPVVIVSGLAYGIDITAHRAALSCDCKTVAILAHGLNTIYPSSHRKTAIEIARGGGMLLTDYRSTASIHKGNFLARNRIVAGVCDCIVVVESAEKGGALVTARLAGDYDREVLALPGRITDKYSAGCNKLISKHQAHLLYDADDLIDKMNWTKREEESSQQELFPTLNPEEENVLTYIRHHGEGQINRMTVDLNLNIGKLTGILIELEFKGLISSYPGAKYRPA